MLADVLIIAILAINLPPFQQLGAQHPEQVYKFGSETFCMGEAINARERLTRKARLSAPETLRSEVPTLHTYVTLRDARARATERGPNSPTWILTRWKSLRHTFDMHCHGRDLYIHRNIQCRTLSE